MLYHLLHPLHDQVSVFNVFRYITFRSALAALTALLLSLVLGYWVIGRLREMQVGQSIREEGPKTHRAKAGTPTMGGLLIIAAIVVPTLLWADLSNRLGWIAVASVLLFGVIGFLDDYLKVIRRNNRGLSTRSKFGLQLLAALALEQEPLSNLPGTPMPGQVQPLIPVFDQQREASPALGVLAD